MPGLTFAYGLFIHLGPGLETAGYGAMVGIEHFELLKVLGTGGKPSLLSINLLSSI